MIDPLDFKEPQGFTAQSAEEAMELCQAVFVGPVPDSVIWAVALAFDRAKYGVPKSVGNICTDAHCASQENDEA